MSPRRVWPRSWEHHERKAAETLARYSQMSGWTPTLPVPVELVVERVHGLRIVTQRLPPGPPGTKILGALVAQDRAIYLNEDHLDLFETWIGPLEFTVAHELGHWLYDADNPDQQSLLAGIEPKEQVFCRGSGQAGLHDLARLRERNADRFAARLLLPEELVRRELPLRGWPNVDIRTLAAEWGVSRRTLEIRLKELHFISRSD